MSDIVVTTPKNRFFFSARGWYFHPVRNKWARITNEQVKVIHYREEFVYDYKVGENVRSLNKKAWVKKKQEEVPIGIYNRLEAL